MWFKEHGITWGLVWKISPILAIIGLIGIFTFPPTLKLISWILLGIGGFDLFFTLCFVFPFVKYDQDTKKLKAHIEKLALFEDSVNKQVSNWRYNLRLNIERVKIGIDKAIPSVTFEMKVISYLPVEVKLIRILKGHGNISAGALGSCDIPHLTETIDKKIRAYDESQLELTVEVGGTRLPDFLRTKLSTGGQLLQWTLKGEWYIEINGKEELWKSIGEEIRFDYIVQRS
jgi:hypothetical protein